MRLSCTELCPYIDSFPLIPAVGISEDGTASRKRVRFVLKLLEKSGLSDNATSIRECLATEMGLVSVAIFALNGSVKLALQG